MTTPAHTLTLNHGALHQLAQLLGAAGLLTEPADLYRAGQMLEEVLPTDLPKTPELAKDASAIDAEKQIRAWMRDGSHVIELSERQRETGKKAIQAAIGKGMLPGGPSSLCLITQFGLAPEA